MISHGTQKITSLRRGTWRITSMTRGTFDILGLFTSPYSKAATAALRAAFPTQWETIRQYGWDHPEIVPWVNATPLIGGYVSGAVEPNAAQYPFQLGLKGSRNFGFVFGPNDILEFSFIKLKSSSQWFDFLTARQAWNSANAIGYIYNWDNNSLLVSTTSGSSQSSCLSPSMNTWYTIKQDMRSGIYVDGVKKISNTKSSSWQSDGPLSVVKDANDRISTNFINVKRNDVLVHRYYPIDNEGTWWDVVDAVIH